MDRTLVISDIHGHTDHLGRAVLSASIDYKPDRDQLILLGDYIDRGPDSKSTLELVRSLVNDGAIALKGNHEYMAVDPDSHELWLHNGGTTTLRDYGSDSIPEENLSFLRQLPYMHVTDTHIFVHAGISFARELEDQDEWEMVWIREKFIDWHYPLGHKTIVFGHTAVSDIRLELFPERFSKEQCAKNELYAPIYPSDWFGNRLAVDADTVRSGWLHVVDVTNQCHWTF